MFARPGQLSAILAAPAELSAGALTGTGALALGGTNAARPRMHGLVGIHTTAEAWTFALSVGRQELIKRLKR